MRSIVCIILVLAACLPDPDVSELATCSADVPCEAGRICEAGLCLIPSGVLVSSEQQDTGRCGDGILRRYVLDDEGRSVTLEETDPRYEVCDDGNAVSGDGCDANCTASACGNGITAPNEECDDGNTIQTDDCLSDCKRASCGDGFLQAEIERCDDGASNSDLEPNACRLDCRPASCGDEVVDTGESCDDGVRDNANDSSCRVDCQLNVCGDGFLRTDLQEGDVGYEACDDGNEATDDSCVDDCRLARCGDGYQRLGLAPDDAAFEACDDGDVIDGNDCTNDCTIGRCGDGVVHDQGQGTEQCDDGNPEDRDSCLNSCRTASCGDGIQRGDVEEGTEGFEACDDGNEIETDACLSHCVVALCGDGIRRADVAEGGDGFEACDSERNCNEDCENTCGDGEYDGEFGEECDDGDEDNADSCLNDCVLARCGDGILRQDREPGQDGYEACEAELVGQNEADCSVRCERVPSGVTLGEVGGMGRISGVLGLDEVGGSFTLTNDRVWHLLGRVQVPDGGVLRIERGTEIRGGIDPEAGTSVLVVHPGGRIVADGSEAEPIVFTSLNNFRQPGDWGGLVLLGRARSNCDRNGQGGCPDTIPALEANGLDLPYGGNDNFQNNGILRYVRVEYAGACAEYVGNQCLHHFHPLTLAGAGSATVLDRLQIHRSGADGIRIFGGWVNIRRVLVTQPRKNGVAWSHGWWGHAQFVIVQHMANSADPGAAFSGDSNEHNHNAGPRSYPSIANVTAINGRESVRLATGSSIELVNGIFANWSEEHEHCFRAYDNTFWDNDEPGNVVRNNYFNCHVPCWENRHGDCSAIATQDDGVFSSNRTLDPTVQGQRVSLVRPESRAPDFRPEDFEWGPHTGINPGGFLQPAAYLGALATQIERDWTSGWTNFDRLDGLIAHVGMDGDDEAALLHEQTGRHPLSLSGPTQEVAGLVGTARSFSNGRFGEFGEAFPSLGPSDRTAQFWLKVSDQPNTPKAELFSFGRPGIRGTYFAGLMCRSGQLAFNGGRNETDSVDCVGQSIADGQWHLVTFTYRQLNVNYRLAIYVDDELVVDDTIDPLNEIGGNPGRIGSGRNDINQGFTLQMDEFRYFDRALDLGEIRRSYMLERMDP